MRRRRGLAERPWALTGVLTLVLGTTHLGCSDARAPVAVPALPADIASPSALDSVALVRPPGVRGAQVSSYDRTGGNADLGVGANTLPILRSIAGVNQELDNSWLYRDGDRYVIFDSLGPGVVERIWMTGFDTTASGDLSGDIAFEFDDEPSPRLALSRADLFSGRRAPFLAPFAGNATVSSGGYYSVLPLPYARRLRISTSSVPNYVQITYASLPPGASVSSFDPAADASAAAAALAATGGDPKSTVPTRSDEVELSVGAGASQVVWDRAGPATIVRFEILAPPGAEIPVGLRLQMTWDGASAPQVDTPLDELFCASLGPAARSIAYGRDGDRLYLYLPMPFRSHARIVLRNDGPALEPGWSARIGTVEGPPAAGAAFFHAAANAAHLEPDGHDYVLLDTGGSGQVVAVNLTTGCARKGACQLPLLPGLDGAHLEGDERISLDGSRYPQIHGTGTEDFFSGGFYFSHGPFTLPTHGNTAQAASSPRRPGINLRNAYRLFLAGPIAFYDGARLTIEHGPVDDVAAEMSSVVLYYALPDASLIQTDRLTLGDGASETEHALSAEDRQDRSLTSAFRGEAYQTPVTASGFEATVTRFRVAVDVANHGVRLRRLADIALGRQSALVSVNGTPAGTWYSADVNPVLRWADLDFELPASLTAGRDSLAIEIDARSSPNPWTAYGYVALSYR